MHTSPKGYKDRPIMGGWKSMAACVGMDQAIFYPDSWAEGAVRRAKKVCERCIVRTSCGEYALAHEGPEGIWGGMTPDERRSERLRRDRRR